MHKLKKPNQTIKQIIKQNSHKNMIEQLQKLLANSKGLIVNMYLLYYMNYVVRTDITCSSLQS